MDQQTDDNPFRRYPDLNETLTSLPIFSCKKCNGFLTPPIRLAEGIGHVCGTCDLPETTVASHDSSLELVLQNLEIPCPNASRGCNEKFKYADISSHISSCLQRNYVCPFKFLSDCSWEGVSLHILDHVKERHPENVIEADNGVFPLSFDYSTNHDIVKILQMGCDKFILRVKVTKHTLYYLVYYIGSKDKAQKYSCSLDDSNCALHHTSESKVLHDLLFDSYDKYSDCSAVSIDLTVKTLTQQSTLETVIKIFKKNSTNKEQDESHKLLLNSFECPICRSFMRPPIYQCYSGHSVCQNCKPLVKKCPLCNRRIGFTRNYSLESVASHVKYPCQYQNDGCEVVLPYPNILDHEDECEVKPYSCPLGCSWTGTHVDIIPHLKELHAKNCCFGDFEKGRISINGNNTETISCLITNGDTFRVCGKQNEGDIFWTVQYVGPQSRTKNYMYELAFLNIENDNQKLVWSDVCQNFEFKKDNMVKFSGTLFSHFNVRCVRYYCRISQNNTF